MELHFPNESTLAVSQIAENKRIYSSPQKWELKLTVNSALTSEALDILLKASNLSPLTLTNNAGEEFIFSGYNDVDSISKYISEQGTTMTIVLQKSIAEETEDEN